MKLITKQRSFSFLIIAGASILLFRTLRMVLVERALETTVFPVLILLFIEMASNLLCIVFSARWFLSNDRSKSSTPLRFAAFSTVLHAIRVLIYVLGRTGPWINFDVKLEYRSTYEVVWLWVWFAAIMSVLGVVGVVVIWVLRRRRIL